MKSTVKLCVWLASALAIWSLAAGASAADADLPSIEDLFRPAWINTMHLSPDGRHVIALGHVGDASAVMLVDADSGASKIIDGPDRGWSAPDSAGWVTNDQIAVSRFRDANVITLSSDNVRRLHSRYYRTVRPDAQGHERVLVQSRDAFYRIERVDVRTGRREGLNFDMPGQPVRWVLDRDGNPLVVTTQEDSKSTDERSVTHWYRRSLEEKWQPLATFPITAEEWWPFYLMDDGRSLAVWSRQGRDTVAVFRYDLQEKRIVDLLAGHPTEDIGRLARRDDQEYQRVVTLGMKAKVHWFDARWDALQRAVDEAIPGKINWLTGNSKGRVLVASHGDVDPGQWYILDTANMHLRKIAAARPWLDSRPMQPKQLVQYRSSDGLVIPAYLTLPAGGKKPGAAVVLIHGGPWARDHWDWDPEVQLLASRGYAVLQPQFRGSVGFGLRFMQAGIGQWGLAMQDDITAGAKWLVSEGVADPARMCILGGSYGGYATLWGLVKTPDLFRCGASFAGVSDLKFMFTDDSDSNDDTGARMMQRAWVGDPKTMGPQFDAVSPLRHAAEIKAPVFIAHGDRDARVPIEHSEKMVDALKANRKDVTWMKLPDEGHGIWATENQKRYYQALLDFLDKHIGQKSALSSAAATKTEGATR